MCSHTNWRFVALRGSGFPQGVTVCEDCNAIYVTEGDHDSRWITVHELWNLHNPLLGNYNG